MVELLTQDVDAREDLEVKRQECARPARYQPARVPGDLNTILGPLKSGAFSELSPEVMSTDPWVVYFHKFLAEDEVKALEDQLFSRDFMKSAAGYGGKNSARHSETAFCTPPCDEHPAVQTMYQRASNITHVPLVNFDFVQAARYKKGMFFKVHHDNHPTFNLLPCGTRIYSIFVYLTNVKEGGATAFPRLGLKTPAKRGAAVLFQNTLDSDPEQSDDRTEHEALPVVRGEKRGLNMWLYHYNYRDSWAKGCTTIELADDLGRAGLTAATPVDDADEYTEGEASQSPKQSKTIFENTSPVPVEIFWVSTDGEEKSMGITQIDQPLRLNTSPGHTFRARVSDSSRKLVGKYTVRKDKTRQVVNVTPGRKGKKHKKRPDDEF